MASEEIKKIIKEFTSVQHKEQALMVCGKWGIGKTYFLKNLKAEELGKKKIVLISLKGIKTREDINRRAVAKILGIGRKLNCLSKGVNAVISKLSSWLSNGWLNISISDLIELGVSWKEFQDVILIFDDFERIDNESISYSDVLFLIHSTFVEEKNTSALIVANEDEIPVNPRRKGRAPLTQEALTEEEKSYLNAKEKTIIRTVGFEQDLGMFFIDYIKSRYNYVEKEIKEIILQAPYVQQIVERKDSDNLREYNRFFDSFIRIIRSVKKSTLDKQHQNLFLKEVAYCLRYWIFIDSKKQSESQDWSNLYNTDPLYINHSLFPSIRHFWTKGFLDEEQLCSDIERRFKYYLKQEKTGKDLAIISSWYRYPQKQVLSACRTIGSISNAFDTIDEFLEVSRWLKWIFKSGLIPQNDYNQVKKSLLDSFQIFIEKKPNLNLTLSGQIAEEEFIDAFNTNKELHKKKILKKYEEELFPTIKLTNEPEFVEFARQNTILVLDMYLKHIGEIAEVNAIYDHVRFLVGFLRDIYSVNYDTQLCALLEGLIDSITDATAASVLELFFREGNVRIPKEALVPLLEKLKGKKEELLISK